MALGALSSATSMTTAFRSDTTTFSSNPNQKPPRLAKQQDKVAEAQLDFWNLFEQPVKQIWSKSLEPVKALSKRLDALADALIEASKEEVKKTFNKHKQDWETAQDEVSVMQGFLGVVESAMHLQPSKVVHTTLADMVYSSRVNYIDGLLRGNRALDPSFRTLFDQLPPDTQQFGIIKWSQVSPTITLEQFFGRVSESEKKLYAQDAQASLTAQAANEGLPRRVQNPLGQFESMYSN